MYDVIIITNWPEKGQEKAIIILDKYFLHNSLDVRFTIDLIKNATAVNKIM